MKYVKISNMLLIFMALLSNNILAAPYTSQDLKMPFLQSSRLNDKKTTVQFGGVLQWDYALDKYQRYTEQSSSGFRRSRLYIKGDRDNWQYKATLKLGESSKTNGDAVELYIRYIGLGALFNITVGKQKEPFSLEYLTSSKDISLLERSAIAEYYAYGPTLGVQLHGKGNNWTYGLGIFESDNVADHSFRKLTLTGRMTQAVTFANQAFIHLGTGFTSRRHTDDDKSITHYNLEFAAVYNAVHMQTEYFYSTNPHISSVKTGHYIQLGYIFNGSSLYKDGVFKGVKPSTNQGALAFVGRYEKGLGKYSDINLGKQQGKQVSTGLNYYLKNNLRIGISYMIGEIDATSVKNKELRARLQCRF